LSWQDVPVAEADTMVQQKISQTPFSSGVPRASVSRDLCTSAEETVPDLKLLDETPDPATRGFNPYETSSDFQWKPGDDNR